MGLTIRVKQSLTRNYSASQIAFVIGLLFGIVLIGYSRVNPSNTDWIFDGDRLGNQIVWNYFRRSEFVQWPLNLISNYGNGWSNYGHGSNIFISLPLKYLSFFIPNNFQFLGLWICVCCALQGYFAAKLMGLFSTQRISFPTRGDAVPYDNTRNIDGSLRTITYYAINNLIYKRKDQPYDTYGGTDLKYTKKALYQSASILFWRVKWIIKL